MSNLKYGDEVFFKPRLEGYRSSVGELRICDKCNKKSFINGAHVIEDCRKMDNYINEDLEEYTPEITDDGETICQFCNQLED